MTIHPETLRRWMLAEGLWKRARKAQPQRKRRDRKAHFGELVQMDGSFHDWYQTRAGEACLMNMVDDATSTVEALLGEQETIWAAARVLRLRTESEEPVRMPLQLGQVIQKRRSHPLRLGLYRVIHLPWAHLWYRAVRGVNNVELMESAAAIF